MYKARTSTSIYVNGGQAGGFYLCFVGAHSVNGVLVLPSCDLAVRRFSGVLVLSSCDLDLTVSLECLCCQVATSPLLRSASAAKLRPRRFPGVFWAPKLRPRSFSGVFVLPSCDLAVFMVC